MFFFFNWTCGNYTGDNVSFEHIHLAPLWHMDVAELPVLKTSTSRGLCIKIASLEMLLICLMTASVCFVLPSLRCGLEFFHAIAFWVWKAS